MRSTEQLRALVEGYLGDLALTPELHGQAESVRYALVGGKRVRAVICLATVEAAGADAEAGLPAAAALELVHAFSLVHDDLPALDNDAERRGRPSFSPATRCSRKHSGLRSRIRFRRSAGSLHRRRSA
jgi:geranylgeranyl pyrophosphate synthase